MTVTHGSIISMGEFVEDQTILWFDLKQINLATPVKINMNIPDKQNCADLMKDLWTEPVLAIL